RRTVSDPASMDYFTRKTSGTPTLGNCLDGRSDCHQSIHHGSNAQFPFHSDFSDDPVLCAQPLPVVSSRQLPSALFLWPAAAHVKRRPVHSTPLRLRVRCALITP